MKVTTERVSTECTPTKEWTQKCWVPNVYTKTVLGNTQGLHAVGAQNTRGPMQPTMSIYHTPTTSKDLQQRVSILHRCIESKTTCNSPPTTTP